MSAAAEICSLARWNALCARLDLSADGDTYDALIQAHAEKARAYHTLEHIAACLSHLDDVREKLEAPDEVELALWFHDAIYKPMSSTNEEDSAAWAVDWLEERGANPEQISRIRDHILATKSHEAQPTADGRYLLDIDLSILGARADVYEGYEVGIRYEYRRVPKFIYRKKRKEILQGFLARDRIFATDYFHAKLEDQARANLTRAIAAL